jgi:pilus assembly protein Flp/PilA
MKKFFTNFIKEEEGQGMAEYALILGVLAVGIVGVLLLFGDAIKLQIEKVTELFSNDAGTIE